MQPGIGITGALAELAADAQPDPVAVGVLHAEVWSMWSISRK